MEINIVGLGFVGLTTAIGFSRKGHSIIGIEKDETILNELKKKKIRIHEPGLEKNLNIAINKNQIKFREKILLKKKNIFFLCVGTPLKKNNIYETKYLISAIKEILKLNEKKKSDIVLVIKSTILPDTIQRTIKPIVQNDKKIRLVSNPEFLREGYAWNDFMFPDKIIIGLENNQNKKLMCKIYKDFKSKIFFTNLSTASYIKQLSNAFFSSLVSFSNAFALVGEENKDIEIKKAFDCLSIDKRFYGFPSLISEYVRPGLGFGGYCPPKDISALESFSKNIFSKNYFKSIISINNNIIDLHIHKIKSKIKKKNNNIHILGLSFKPGSNDLRFSKSVELAERLYNSGFKNITLCDPVCIRELKDKFNLKYRYLRIPKLKKNTFYILATAWPKYIKFAKKINSKYLIDTRYKV